MPPRAFGNEVVEGTDLILVIPSARPGDFLPVDPPPDGEANVAGCLPPEVAPNPLPILGWPTRPAPGLSCGCLAWAVDSARRPTYRAAAHLKPTGPSYNTFGDDGAASAGYRSVAGSETATAGPGESVATCGWRCLLGGGGLADVDRAPNADCAPNADRAPPADQ